MSQSAEPQPPVSERAARRSRWKRVLVVVVVLLLVALAAAAAWFSRAVTPVNPSGFYTVPDPLPPGAPGMLIRRERITGDLPPGADAWRIMYLSTGFDGKPVAVSGLVIAPQGKSATPRPVLAWTNGTVGVQPQCGTSHTNRPFSQIPALDLLIDEGFVVVATDYPGISAAGVHPYLVGPVAAYAALDSVRAARSMDVSAGDRFVVWGRSQGGHSALWAAQTAAQYAPDLTMLGAAASAPAIDLAGIFEYGMDKRAGSIVIAFALYAWSHVYADVNLDALVAPEFRSQFERVAGACITTPLAFLTLGDIPSPSTYLTVDPLTTEPYKSIIAENTPKGPIDVPLLISHGTGDTLIPYEGSEKEAARRCAAGETVLFARYPGVQHDAASESAIMTVGWLLDRFAGRPAPSSCAAIPAP